MAKCRLCNKKIKFPRKCQALNEVICSSCCGNKKESEIQCTNGCNYLVKGQIKENKNQIMKLAKESFNNEFDDIYIDERILQLVIPFEQFVFRKYYDDRNVTDEFITDCYTKIYYTLEEKESSYIFNEVEKDIFNEFRELAGTTKMSIKSQKLIIIRMVKSVDSITGGMFGDRMYLELLKKTFAETDAVAEVIGKI